MYGEQAWGEEEGRRVCMVHGMQERQGLMLENDTRRGCSCHTFWHLLSIFCVSDMELHALHVIAHFMFTTIQGAGVIISLSLQKRPKRLRVGKGICLRSQGSKWQGQDANPGLCDFRVQALNPLLCCADYTPAAATAAAENVRWPAKCHMASS